MFAAVRVKGPECRNLYYRALETHGLFFQTHRCAQERSVQLLTMAQADSRALALGVLAGAAGISLAVVCFRRVGAGGGRVPQLSSHVDHVDGRFGLQTGESEVLDRLGALIHCVSELKEEVRALKEALPHLQDNVRVQLRGPSGEDVGARRVSPLHRTPTRRKRAGVTARIEGQSSEDAESEGGYITALTDSDEEQSDEDLNRTVKEPVDDLTSLLQKADCLHSCNGTEKAQGLDLLLEKKEEYNEKCQYLWRLSRAYADAHDCAVDLAEKKRCAENGKKIGEEAISINPLSAESHQWYAILCGLLSEYESIQNKIKNGYLFKDHLDKAIELKPEDPLSYYLLGRWCYAVAQCTWIERKIAATLFGEPPSATVQDALQNFLKCYKDMGQRTQARQMCDAASAMSVVTKEDEEAQKELVSLVSSL
ncbi:regulator of microtubule dynamics protein 2 isoform X2 [Triplophysa dalaica]|uniref:regulator of microtubule dynamics protein 2 isoform X2 n=1 Tax=Triplophysa dalaica TaxID=1582913 RepID=UPI0024E03809|nr:regulator of microtubule dynamics protein 2 isoform X2 [Triplophysa dalaica]